MNDKEMTAEILRRLRLVPEHKSDINFPEFRWCAGLAGSRRADVFFIQPRPPYFSITYEVKVDRWDFRRDMAEFGKHRKARQFSNFFYYAAPKGLIDPADIPEWAGLVEFDLGILADEYTQGMSVVKQAPLHDREDPDWGLIAGIANSIKKKSQNYCCMRMRTMRSAVRPSHLSGSEHVFHRPATILETACSKRSGLSPTSTFEP